MEKRFPLMQVLQWYPEPSDLYLTINFEYGIEIALYRKAIMIHFSRKPYWIEISWFVSHRQSPMIHQIQILIDTDIPQPRRFCMKRMAISLFILVCAIHWSWASPFSNETTGTIQAYADYCTFKGDSAASYVEVYIQTLLKGLEMHELEDGSVQVEIGIDVELVNAKDKVIGQRSWTIPGILPSREEARREGLSLFDLFDSAVQPGEYWLNLKIRDVYGDKQDSMQISLTVPQYHDEELEMADIQLARSIDRVDESTGLWIKNGYRVIPHPSRRFGESLPEIALYTEVYGLDESTEDAERFTALFTIRDMLGSTVLTKGPFFMQKGGPSAVLVDRINVSDLKPGFYVLRVAVADTMAFSMKKIDDIAVMEKPFVRGESIPEVPGFRGLTPPESAAAEIELRYMASDGEVKKFRELTPVGRARYLEQLWLRKDPDPATPENEARTELHRRIANAQNSYGEMRRKGMDTDRGHVYIKYGPPNDVTIERGERVCKDHEIWHYYREREYIFVFLDEFGTGEYRLIHSNFPGEVERSDWEDIVCEPTGMQRQGYN